MAEKSEEDTLRAVKGLFPGRKRCKLSDAVSDEIISSIVGVSCGAEVKPGNGSRCYVIK